MMQKRRARERGQSLVEALMVLGVVVAIAIVINSLLHPIVIDAFKKMSDNLSAVGP
jgi:hypothetical protein